MQLVVPATRIREVLREMDNGASGAHFGINETLSKIRESFYWVRWREDVESCLKDLRSCSDRRREQVQEVCQKLKGYHDGLQEKLPSVHEMLHHKNRVASGRMKTRYDLRDNSVEFQTGDLEWLYNPQRRNGRFPKLSPDWEGAYIFENEDCSLRPPHEVGQ